MKISSFSAPRKARVRDGRPTSAKAREPLDGPVFDDLDDEPVLTHDLIREPVGDVDETPPPPGPTSLSAPTLIDMTTRTTTEDISAAPTEVPAPSDDTGPTPPVRRWAFFRFPTWAQRKRTLHKQAWAVVVLVYAQLFFGYFFPHDYRSDSEAHLLFAWAAFMAQTFLYHAGLVVGVIAAVALWRGKHCLFTLAMPLAVLTVAPVWWSAMPKTPQPTTGPGVKVMSINLLMINHDVDGILDEVARENPDVIMLQEYTAHWHTAFHTRLGEDYPYFAGIHQEDSFGSAIYSRVPFTERPVTEMKLGEMKMPQVRAVIEIDGLPVALYNVHLLPPRSLSYTRYQHRQFADLLERLRDEPRPVVLAGDFNFTGSSPMARDLDIRGYADTHDLAGVGVDATWPVKGSMRYWPVPGLRIDHVFLSDHLTATSHRTGYGAGSDHRPVITTIARRGALQ
ncbi:MAG: hypothetical protein GC159_21770 [Phycisphaera sp.]|nr:hypothetical protein [Phycisphaera sp.]